MLKIPGTNGTDPRQSGFPIFNISGYTSLGNTNNWSPVERNDRLYTYVGKPELDEGRAQHPGRLRFPAAPDESLAAGTRKRIARAAASTS